MRACEKHRAPSQPSSHSEDLGPGVENSTSGGYYLMEFSLICFYRPVKCPALCVFFPSRSNGLFISRGNDQAIFFRQHHQTSYIKFWPLNYENNKIQWVRYFKRRLAGESIGIKILMKNRTRNFAIM